ncbi:pimeloyl-ACP methyl ester carboxylesterase [Leucobacter komagatae]|uniref:Pimeloyl-ACP methyl ester carboxylesterase n=1 Tax=Leucobacter komagatae TaxID=55969 RepID=A0A542Y295_9MICO|nr:alpha/beta hydrolase [Leucobacter komagatae]TQL42195.1 pimeloyl-ACP methyl ester carboxylesterase [Leucobacter komagatae]
MQTDSTWAPPTRTLTRGTRTVAFTEFGDPAGSPVIAAHGSPGSRFQLLPLHASLFAAGLRLIALDRPGVGSTSPALTSGGFGGDCTDDALAVLDELGITTAVALGFSGGAGYALELARSAPARISRVVLACGAVPGAPRQATRGRIRIVAILYAIARIAPGLATAMLDGRGPFRTTRAANVDAWPAADRAVMADADVQAVLSHDREASAAQGARPAVEDLRLTRTRFPLADVRQPVTLLHGTVDGNVPIDVARWAAAKLTDATLTEFPDLGHYFAVSRPDAVVAALR